MEAKTKRQLIKGAVLLAALLLAYRTRGTWLKTGALLALSAAFSLLLAPVCVRLERRGMKPSHAALVSVFALVLAIALFLLLFVPYLFTHTMELVRRMTPTVTLVVEQAGLWLSSWGVNFEPQTNFPQLIASALTPLTAGIAKGGVAVVLTIGHVAFSLVIAYYLLTVRSAAGCHLLLLIPTRYRSVFLSSLMGCKNAVLSYLSGLLKTSAFVGGATFVALAFLGVRDSLILALFMGLLEVLPYIGPILGAIPILISAMPMGLMTTLLALLFVLIIQQIESGVIGPYFTASSTSIHPLAAIIGVFVGGSLFGIAGILLTVPALVVCRSVLWSWRSASIQFDS